MNKNWIIIIIIIIINPLHGVFTITYLKPWNKPCLQSIQCSSCSVVTIYCTCNVISRDVRSVLHITTFRSMCAMPSTAVFCSSWLSCLSVMLLRYFLHSFVMVPVAPIMTCIISISTRHIACIYIIKSLYYYS